MRIRKRHQFPLHCLLCCHKQTFCLSCFEVACMNTVLHIPVTPPSFILFSFSHPRLPLIFQGFSISPPSSFRFLSPPSLAANPLLLPPLHPLLPEGFEKLLHNALQIITKHALWIRVGWGVVIWQTLQDLIRSKAMKLPITCFAD